MSAGAASRSRVRLVGVNAQQQVIAAAEDRASALAAGDAQRLAGLLHEGFSWTSHTGATYSRSEYVRRNTQGHPVWRSQRLSVVEVVVVGDAAVLHAEVTDEVLGEDDEPDTFRMPMTHPQNRGLHAHEGEDQ